MDTPLFMLAGPETIASAVITITNTIVQVSTTTSGIVSTDTAKDNGMSTRFPIYIILILELFQSRQQKAMVRLHGFRYTLF